MSDREFSEWLDRARVVPISDEISRRGGLNLKRGPKEFTGPCPKCGGDDRFAVNIAKNVFNCRQCRAKGDVIDFVKHVDGVDFMTACTTLAGPAPNGNADTARADIATKIVVATFGYRDQSGKLLFAVDRIEYRRPRHPRQTTGSHLRGALCPSPHGQSLPVVIAAMIAIDIWLLPVPGSPAMHVCLPRAMRPGHSQSIFSGSMSAAQRVTRDASAVLLFGSD